MKDKGHGLGNDKEHRLKTYATKGGHMGPPLRGEPGSIISFAIERGIREEPGLAAAEMLKLIRENARLEAKLFLLREKLGELARGQRE